MDRRTHEVSEHELPAEVDRGRTLVPATPRLSASWRRSVTYGVAPDVVNPSYVGTVDDESLFFRCGHEVLQGLHDTLANEPVSVMLTDAEGLVLNRLTGDPSLDRSLDRRYLAPGFAFGEQDAGTNGLGMALADRVPTLVRGEEHYCSDLWDLTCAAVPVNDPDTGQLLGSVNLTTFSEQADRLLLALAQAAAAGTAALMLARSRGMQPRRQARGRIFRVRDTASDSSDDLSPAWQAALMQVESALADGRTVGVVGEPGVGKAALLGAALRRRHPRHRILTTQPPEPKDADTWLSLWATEVGKPYTSFIIGRVDDLPSWVAEELAHILESATAFTITAHERSSIPRPLHRLVEEIAEIPPLRYRPDDVLPLAHRFARRARGRDVQFTAAAVRALSTFGWPGNATQLREVIRNAAVRSDIVDVHHLDAEISSGASRRLSRIEAVERDEIMRALAEPGMTPTRAADLLGISRATIYRKISVYGIAVPARGLSTR